MRTILLSYGRDKAINDFTEWLALVSNVTKTVKMLSKQIKEICVCGYAFGNTLFVQSFLNVLTKNKLEFQNILS